MRLDIRECECLADQSFLKQSPSESEGTWWTATASAARAALST